jgi:uncharacterized membrane protein YwzB
MIIWNVKILLLKWLLQIAALNHHKIDRLRLISSKIKGWVLNKQFRRGLVMIFVTGGAGFIGANFVLSWLAQSDETVLNYDKLTYAGNLNNLTSTSR